jgi:hypothetical protein
MEFHILGPFEVIADGQALHLGGQKQRALLAILLLEANRVVSASRLFEALWEASRPRPRTRPCTSTCRSSSRGAQPRGSVRPGAAHSSATTRLRR